MDNECFNRLNRAETDHDLSQEVLAGLMNERQELIVFYIREKLKCHEPSEIARGLMVVGFSDESEFNTEVISRYENCSGFLSAAQKAAKYAYDRNRWARSWFQEMCTAEEPVEYWRYSMLFLKIVDARFATWHQGYARSGNPIATFERSLVSHRKNRYDQWRKHRLKTLFGSKAPNSIFLFDPVFQR